MFLNPDHIVDVSNIDIAWDAIVDTVNEKPVFLQRDNDFLLFCSADLIKGIVKDLSIVVNQFVEDDGSITVTPAAVDLVDNGETLAEAKETLIDDLIDYAKEYFNEFELFSKAPNRKDHLPYVMKVLTADSRKEIEKALIFQPEEI